MKVRMSFPAVPSLDTPFANAWAEWKLWVFVAAIVIVAELIGSFSISAGPARIGLLPLLWALLMGATLGLGAGVRLRPSSSRCCAGRLVARRCRPPDTGRGCR
ncbi:MAG: DUF3100 domain-containing protein [Variovorax sp.]|nr:DUF3100 domain-containing protein [Variovorax sp.]